MEDNLNYFSQLSPELLLLAMQQQQQQQSNTTQEISATINSQEEEVEKVRIALFSHILAVELRLSSLCAILANLSVHFLCCWFICLFACLFMYFYISSLFCFHWQIYTYLLTYNILRV